MNRPAHYRMTKRPGFIPVKNRRDNAPLPTLELPEIVTVDKVTECHVTPPDVAARMVAYLGPQGDYLTLEPSAGTGNLSRALIAAGHSKYELCQVEKHIRLSVGIRAYGSVINRCFLEYAEEARGKVEFPRVIMNPPFSAVKKHIRAAISLMGSGGHTDYENGGPYRATLVALVPITFELAGAETLETLPDDTFSTAKVRTKIIRFRKD